MTIILLRDLFFYFNIYLYMLNMFVKSKETLTIAQILYEFLGDRSFDFIYIGAYAFTL